jgi:hypothetical protein
MNGEMFLKNKAAIPKLRDIPVLIISAYTHEAGRFPERFLAKPFRLEALIAEIHRCLDEHPENGEPLPANLVHPESPVRA